MGKINDLVEAFRRLNKRQLANLKEHERRRTPICCGNLASYFWRNGAG